ncbi:MAG: hypothetical protein HWE24_07355 [Oceanospirillaceae bacterium]|nr:hypothetical protein [Oceanospirillaceae bacterium]
MIRDSTISADLELMEDGRYAYWALEDGNWRDSRGDWRLESRYLYLNSDLQQPPSNIPKHEIRVMKPKDDDSLHVRLWPLEGRIRYLQYNFYLNGVVVNKDTVIASSKDWPDLYFSSEYIVSDSVEINIRGISPIILNTEVNRSFGISINEYDTIENLILNNQRFEIKTESCRKELVRGELQLANRILCEPVVESQLYGTYNIANQWPYDFASLKLQDNQRFEYQWEWQGGRGITTGDWHFGRGLLILHSDIQQVPEGSSGFEIESATLSNFEGYRINMYNSVTPDLLLLGEAKMYLNGELIQDVSSSLVNTGQFELPHQEHDSIVIELYSPYKRMVFSLGEENEVVIRVDVVNEMFYRIFDNQAWFLRKKNNDYELFQQGSYRPFLKPEE